MKMGPFPRINVGAEFTRVVRTLGGQILDDEKTIEGQGKADYWFPEYNTVVELKRLEKDLTNDAQFVLILRRMASNWIRTGKISPSMPPVRFNLQGLPLECAQDVLSNLKRRLEGVVKKANRQIKSVKAQVKRPDAKGLLVLANDGNLVWKPDLFSHLIGRILLSDRPDNLKSLHTSIHAVTYFAPNHPAFVPGAPMPSFLWIDGIIPGREPPPQSLRQKLQKAWEEHHAALAGKPLLELEGPRNLDDFERIQFLEVPDGIYRFGKKDGE